MTNDSNEPNEKEQHSDRKWKILVGILSGLLILSGGCIIFWGGVPFFPASTPNEGGSTSQGIGLVVDPNANEYVEQKPASGIAIPGFDKMKIPANTRELVGINLYNPKANEGKYYLTYKLCLLDNKGEVSEVLYESQLIPPNNVINDITLSHGLAEGEYDAVMKVQPYRIMDNSPTNCADLSLTIIVSSK